MMGGANMMKNASQLCLASALDRGRRPHNCLHSEDPPA